MITRNDCLILLADLEKKNIDTKEITNELFASNQVPINVIKFINNSRPLEANNFYEHIRKSYNHKKSNLYINIVKEELKDPNDVLTTLASLNLQILLYSKKIENKQMFFRHMRFGEICACLLNYSKTYDLTNCIKLLYYIKSDLKAFEYINKNEV